MKRITENQGRLFGSPRGFTLVEALVSVAIFALGIAALMPMVVANVRANDAAGVRSKAVAVCQAKIEEFRALTYSQVLEAWNDPATQNGSEAVNETGGTVPPLIFTREYWIENPDPAVPAADEEDLKRVRVEVRWALPGRPAGSVTLVTSRAKY